MSLAREINLTPRQFVDNEKTTLPSQLAEGHVVFLSIKCLDLNRLGQSTDWPRQNLVYLA